MLAGVIGMKRAFQTAGVVVGLCVSGSACFAEGAGPIEVAKFAASDPGETERFGESVAVSGTTVVVGAFLDDHSGLSDAGSAYVFDLVTGQQVAKLIASDADAIDLFGSSVAISGDIAVVGSPFGDLGGVSDAGSAYVFDLAPAGPCSAADLSAPFGIVDLDDVDAFIAAFLIGDPAADLAPNFGIVDLQDVDEFIDLFLAGCP